MGAGGALIFKGLELPVNTKAYNNMQNIEENNNTQINENKANIQEAEQNNINNQQVQETLMEK